MFTNLRELIATMPNEEQCRAYVAQQRWNGKTVCPYCSHDKCYTIEGGKRYKCASKSCFKRFTVTVGTIFEASNIPLNKWLPAIYLVTAHKKSISSYQLAKDIGITQKSAWFVIMRIREVLKVKEPVMLGENNAVEADETFVGGKYANMHKARRNKLLANGSGFTNKTTVLGIVERGGKLVAKVIPQRNSFQLATQIASNVIKSATLITDDTNLYDKVKHSYTHHSVNHSAYEYVKDNNIHTNTIEGAFSLFKRQIVGTHHQITSKHTQRYCDEFTYKYNSRDMKDADRFALSIKSLECRLKYKTLIANPVVEFTPVKVITENTGKGVFQIKDGEIVGHYKSIYAAVKITGINKRSITNVCKGKQITAGGYQWCFA